MGKYATLVEETINEASLSRVWQQSGPEYAFVILTAFRGEFDIKENRKRNAELKKKIRKAGFGFWELEGHWIENRDKPDIPDDDVEEDSFFISVKKGTEGSSENLRKFALEQSQPRNYNQDAFVFKPEGTDIVEIVNQDGSSFTVGKFHAQKIAQAYSRMKTGPMVGPLGPNDPEDAKKGRTFVFEKARTSRGYAGTMLDVVQERNKGTE